MKQRLLELAGLAAGLALIVAAPDVALLLIVLLLPFTLIGAAAGTWYLRHVFRQQRPPRSRFFGMLVNMSVRHAVVGSWVGYLTMARLGDRTGWYALPSAPANVTAPVTGLVLLVFMVPPIVYAVTVWRVRRASTVVGQAGRDQELNQQGAGSGSQLDRMEQAQAAAAEAAGVAVVAAEQAAATAATSDAVGHDEHAVIIERVPPPDEAGRP